MHDYSYIKSLFIKFIADECTSEEIEILIEYLRTSDGSDNVPQIEEVRAKLGSLPQLDEPRSNEIFSQIISRDALSVNTAHTPPRHQFSAWVGKVAAAFIGVLFLAGIGWWYYNYEIRTALYTTTFGEVKTFILPDGTEVVLNANSTLRICNNTLEDSVREVWLEGEAFFSVNHTPDHRTFVVHTAHELLIEVLGTEFNVNSREEKAIVVLNSGKVKVRLTEDSRPDRIMNPGELIEYKAEDHHIDQKEVDTLLYTSWRNNLLVFRDTSLKKIAQLMTDNYGYEVKFENDSLAQLSFTGSVPANHPELLLQTLSVSFDLNVAQDGKRITVDSR